MKDAAGRGAAMSAAQSTTLAVGGETKRLRSQLRPEAAASPTSQLDNALWALGHGFRVFACLTGGKEPNGLLVRHGALESTTDEAQVRKWWARCPNGNAGIHGGVIVDCDTGINSLAEAEAWRKKVGLPPTLAVRTGRRTSFGVQFHYTGETKTGPYELRDVSGEVRSGNAYGMAPGSIHPDMEQPYLIVIDLPRAAYPLDCQLEQSKKKAAKTLSQDPAKLKSGEKIKPSFRQYWLVSQCGRFRRTGLGGDPLFAALRALRDQYCERPEEKTDAMLRQICESGEKNYGIHAPGLDSRPGEPDTSRPQIIVRTGEIPQATDQAEEILLEHARRLGIFRRAGELVKVIRLRKARKDSRLKRPSGTLMLEPLTPPMLADALDRIASFQKWNAREKKNVPIDCPGKIVTSYLSRKVRRTTSRRRWCAGPWI